MSRKMWDVNRSERFGMSQAPVEENAGGNERGDKDDGEEKPTPVAGRVTQHANERAAVEIRHNGDGRVADGATDGDEREKSLQRISRSAGRREKHAGGEGKRDRGGGDQ